MKKIYFCLLLALWSPPHLRAQVSDPTRATLNNIFAPLDKSQVPTGFLAEYATPLVPLDIFNGTLTDSSRTSPDGFRYIYATLYSAFVYGSQLPTIQDLNSRIATAETNAGPGTIPLMAQRIDYATVRADAFSTNLLAYQNGQVVDVAGRAQNPYQMRTAFAVAPTRAYSATGNVSLIMPSAIYTQRRFYGGPPYPTGKYLDFGDGRGYLPVTWDQAIATSYSTAGTKRVKVRFVYYDGMSYESHFDLEVATTAAATTATSSSPTTNSKATTYGTLQTTAFDTRVDPIAGVRAGGTAYVYYGAGHSQLTKPFIVAEGFDPHVAAPITQSNYSFSDFLRAIQTAGSFNYFSQLYNAGYDIVFIDYDNGTDDILLNAKLFEEVLNRVNASKTGTEQNVVLGISMGGLVARYQLAEMVKNSRPTQTRLLILQDSPQRGANVPLGIQALVRQAYVNFGGFTLFDIDLKLAQLNGLIDQPATKQLLLYRATDASSGFAANTFLDGVYRPKITFPAGQAPPYQVIAASQGSQCGNALFAPYTELVRGDGNIFISPMPWIHRVSYKAQVIANAIPANGQANRVATLQFYAILRLFGFINIRVDFVREDYSCPAGLLAVDGAPGGTQYVGARVPPNTLKLFRKWAMGQFCAVAVG